MTFGIDAGLPIAVSTVGKCVGRSIAGIQFDALAIINVDGSTLGIGKRQSCQFDSTFVTAFQLESSVVTVAGEFVGDFARIRISNRFGLYQNHVWQRAARTGHEILEIIIDGYCSR